MVADLVCEGSMVALLWFQGMQQIQLHCTYKDMSFSDSNLESVLGILLALVMTCVLYRAMTVRYVIMRTNTVDE